MTTTRRLLVVFALLLGLLLPAGLTTAAPRLSDINTLGGPQYFIRKTYYSDATYSVVVGYHEKLCNGTFEQYGIVTEYVEPYLEACNGGVEP